MMQNTRQICTKSKLVNTILNDIPRVSRFFFFYKMRNEALIEGGKQV